MWCIRLWHAYNTCFDKHHTVHWPLTPSSHVHQAPSGMHTGSNGTALDATHTPQRCVEHTAVTQPCMWTALNNTRYPRYSYHSSPQPRHRPLSPTAFTKVRGAGRCTPKPPAGATVPPRDWSRTSSSPRRLRSAVERRDCPLSLGRVRPCGAPSRRVRLGTHPNKIATS